MLSPALLILVQTWSNAPAPRGCWGWACTSKTRQRDSGDRSSQGPSKICTSPGGSRTRIRLLCGLVSPPPEVPSASVHAQCFVNRLLSLIPDVGGAGFRVRGAVSEMGSLKNIPTCPRGPNPCSQLCPDFPQQEDQCPLPPAMLSALCRPLQGQFPGEPFQGTSSFSRWSGGWPGKPGVGMFNHYILMLLSTQFRQV